MLNAQRHAVIALAMVSVAVGLAVSARAAHIRFRVQVPDTTPPGAVIHIAGDFQGWNPGDAAYVLAPGDDGWFEITVDIGDRRRIEYKFTRGSWQTVEKGPRGEELRNRTLEVDGDMRADHVIMNWADGGQGGPGVRATMAERVTGTVEPHDRFPSAHITARHVDVWLPPGYDDDPGVRYPVLYMHDGQNLFDPAQSFIGVDWGIDETMTRLIAEGAVRPAIVVGVWNSPRRYEEYMPDVPGASSQELLSKAYLRFLVHELKPFIDGHYRTLTDRDHTSVMGSSMGGLISAYAMCEYPDVFGGAGCVSTHWPADDGVVIEYLAANLPDPATHRIYFDHGTETLDAGYERYQLEVDRRLEAAGYRQGENRLTRTFPGDDHSERAWRRRVHVPLVFLLGRSE